jgi:hypothetical protein
MEGKGTGAASGGPALGAVSGSELGVTGDEPAGAGVEDGGVVAEAPSVTGPDEGVEADGAAEAVSLVADGVEEELAFAGAGIAPVEASAGTAGMGTGDEGAVDAAGTRETPAFATGGAVGAAGSVAGNATG